MEERRLKNILSHLSAYPPPRFGNSALLNASSKAEKDAVCSPGSTHWHPETRGYKHISRSKSSSDISESRRLVSTEEPRVRGDACYAAPLKDLSSHSYSFVSTTEHMAEVSLCSRKQPSEEAGVLHGFKTHTRGCGSEATEQNRIQYRNSICFHHNCTASGSVKLEEGTQCEALHSKDEPTAGFQEAQIHCRPTISFDRSATGDQSQTFSPSTEGDHHQEIDYGPQMSSRSSDIKQNKEGCNIETCKDIHMHDSEAVEVGNDAMAGSISRNNVRTGQRRHIVEDCIFCLIVQGQSPSFKLYEDEMCVCILDLHPLSHGHALLIPKAHFPSLELTPPEVAAAMCATVPLISMAIMQATNCDSFNLLVNSGKAAGQVVFHTHFHIIPRRNGDNLWRSEDSSRRALPVGPETGRETAVLVQQIRHNLSNKHL